jgi:hypothetical protein
MGRSAQWQNAGEGFSPFGSAAAKGAKTPKLMAMIEK